MSGTTITKSIYLKASREVVWDYLTQPDKLAIWFHAPKEPMTQGAPLKMYGTTSGDLMIWGDVIEARKPEALEYTFTIAPMGEAVSHVKWRLTEVEGGTHLALEHSGLPAGVDAFGLTLALDKGWEDHMATLRADAHA